MKKTIQLLCVLVLGLIITNTTIAQYGPNTYGPEWINPQQQYFKFEITVDGVYKINKDKLREIGWENIPGSQFSIFNRGKEIPLYVTTSSTFGANDYILFVAEKDNDFIDKLMYKDSSLYASRFQSIINDKNLYFLTYSNGNNKRFVKQNNIQPAILPTPELYCLMNVNSNSGQNTRSLGPSFATTQNYYSSAYESGVGMIFPAVTSGSINHQLYTRSPEANHPYPNTYNFNAHNVTSVNSNLNITINNVSYLDTIIPPYSSIKLNALIPGTFLHLNTTVVKYTYNTRTVITNSNIDYVKNLTFDGINATYAKFNTISSKTYLNTTMVTTTTEKAILFDETSNKYYESINGTNVSNKRFFLTDSVADRNMTIVRETAIRNLSIAFKPTTTSYMSKIQEGDYVILTNTAFNNSTLQQFANYRSSANGGNHTVSIINVDSIYDIFSYGKEYHPYAIKSLYNYAKNNWNTKPKYIFIVGRGIIYTNVAAFEANPIYTFKPIPTWGSPGSDNYFVSNNRFIAPEIPIGRISVMNNDELSTYTNKVIAYENNLRNSNNTVASNLWRKRALHIAGATSSTIQNSLIATLNSAKSIIEDSILGMNVTTIYKRDTDPVSSVTDASIDSLINNGVKFITFYGHAGASGFDYNLNDPSKQNSKPKYPIFFAYGCEVGQVNAYNTNRTATDDYLFAENGGSIAMISSNNVGWTGTIPIHMLNQYRELNNTSNYQTLGEVYKNNISNLYNQLTNNKYLEIHCQSILLHGDPALQMFISEKPDFLAETQYIKIKENKVTTSLDSFNVDFKIFNLGKTTKDSVKIVIEHYSNNQVRTSDTLTKIVKSVDSIAYRFPINKLTDNGLNKVRIILDANDAIDETFEDNNMAEMSFNIISDQIKPVYPYEFAITNNSNLELVASTSDLFRNMKNIKFEIDTTSLFNSSYKQTFELQSVGGAIHWTPNISYINNTVYYWRVALDSLVNNELVWNESSFLFLDTVPKGWNQSHYYQYQKNTNNRILLTDNRDFVFDKITNKYISKNANIRNGRFKDLADYINDRELNSSNCMAIMSQAVQISFINPVTGEPLPRVNPCGYHYSANEFQSHTLAGRRAALDFLKSAPVGYYVSIKNCIHGDGSSPAYVNNWALDTLQVSNNNSLYHYLRDSIGFNRIGEINGPQVFCLFFKKNDNSYPVIQEVAQTPYEFISLEADIVTNLDTGSVKSTTIGKAKQWEHFYWNTKSYDSLASNDENYVQIYGATTNNSLVPLAKVYGRDTTLSWIDATIYPSIQLVWHSKDAINRTSAGLDYWRVHYAPVPEAALAPNLSFTIKDTLSQGEINKVKIAVKNISDYDMDSMLVQFRIIDQNNTTHNLDRVRFAPIAKKDSIIVNVDINTDQFTGLNNLFIEANPEDDQVEQYHPNNLGYFSFYVNKDDRNPLLDVTFDGVRILDKDIVSAKPFIKIQLNDENLAKPLSDTSLFELYIAKPSNISNLQRIYVDGSTLKFVAADIAAGKNVAYLEYRPELNEDGMHKLVVKAKDASNNTAGKANQYDVNFTVYNKSTITNVLNYPNPFSTSTAFIFTLTGSEIPSQFKIQILSVTGKVVREITKNEIGPIHIGRNITEYKWDGKDQYGQLLGNGVYLYRVITNIQGDKIEHNANQNVDKFFKNGYGKLYIMR